MAKRVFSFILLLTIGLNTVAFTQTAAVPETAIADRIKAEAVERSQVMDTLAYLTESVGPRLTGSAALREANKWSLEKLKSWGLTNGRLHSYKFGRGWTLKQFSAEVVSPIPFQIVALPRAWSPGFAAPVSGEAIQVVAKSDEELQKFKGKVRGKFVLIEPIKEVPADFLPRANRLTPEVLLDKANAPGSPPGYVPSEPPPNPARIAAIRFEHAMLKFLKDEGAIGVIGASKGSDGGLLQQVNGANAMQAPDFMPDNRVWPWQPGAEVIPQFVFTNDDYNRIARMIEKGKPPVIRMSMQAEFDDSDPMAYNTLADIEGSDLKDEVVMIGAHIDAWHTGTGATDNGTGVAVMMEAARIIKALGLKPRRTIRVALWSGEEQGLLGSNAYVADEFGQVSFGDDGKPRGFKPAYKKFGMYLNLDSGTGAIRGIGIGPNEGLRPLFRQWLRPFWNFKVGDDTFSAKTLSVIPGEGSDYIAFSSVGLNGVEFMQDEIEYHKRTWHTNQDTLDRALPNDLKQAAALVAWFAYSAANADSLPQRY